MNELVVGMDIGGTNTALGLIDEHGNCVSQSALPTAAHEQAEDYVTAVSARITEMLRAAGDNRTLKGIGIGAPNGNYYRGTVEYAPNLRWKGIIPFAAMFQKHFSVPVVLTNDANAAAIGEMIFGAAKPYKHFIVITLGTGVGSGIVVNGELLYGHDGFAGEIGHTIYDPKGRDCGCGRKGCLETYASAGGIKRTVFELLAKSNAESELRSISFTDLTAARITEAAAKGDEIALEAFEVTGRILGIKLADAVAHTSPEVIFLFGGLAQAGQFIFEPTARYMEENMLQIFKHKVKLLPSGLKDNVAVLGAAALIWGRETPVTAGPSRCGD
jgi:glucokinase